MSSAIDSCRRAVLDTEETSDARKELVGKLVKLRIRYYDLRERLGGGGGGGGAAAVGVAAEGAGQEAQGGGESVLEMRSHAFVRYSRAAAATIKWTSESRWEGDSLIWFNFILVRCRRGHL